MTDHDIIQILEKRKAGLQANLDDNDSTMAETKDIGARKKFRIISFNLMHRIDEIDKILSVIHAEKERLMELASIKMTGGNEEKD